jgi:hypothetical protein
VPRDVAAPHRGLERGEAGLVRAAEPLAREVREGVGVAVQVELDQPGLREEAVGLRAAALPESGGEARRALEVALGPDVLVDDGHGGAGEADVEVAALHDVHGAHLGEGRQP